MNEYIIHTIGKFVGDIGDINENIALVMLVKLLHLSMCHTLSYVSCFEHTIFSTTISETNIYL